MNKNSKKITDITGVELAPGEPDACLGNGDRGFECCCDECEHGALNYNLSVISRIGSSIILMTSPFFYLRFLARG